MYDATGGTHADTEALEAERRTDHFPGEPNVDDDTSDELRHLKSAIDAAAEKRNRPGDRR